MFDHLHINILKRLTHTHYCCFCKFKCTCTAAGCTRALGRVSSTNSSATLDESTSDNGEVTGALNRVLMVGRKLSSTHSWFALVYNNYTNNC